MKNPIIYIVLFFFLLPFSGQSQLSVSFMVSDSMGCTTPYSVVATSTVNGGNGEYTYSWILPEGGSSTEANPVFDINTDGFYDICLDVADSDGLTGNYCFNQGFEFIPIVNHLSLDFCEGESYVINGTTYTENSEVVEFFSEGASNGCDSVVNYNLTFHPTPVPEISGNIDVNCLSPQTFISASSGYASYIWNNGQTTETIVISSIGTYTVTVTDANGCTGESSIEILGTSVDISIANIENITCASSGSIDINVLDGVPPYAYQWNGPGGFTSTLDDISGLTMAGTYTVLVTDSNGCASEVSVELLNGSDLQLTSNITSACPGESNGEVTVNVTGGCLPYTYTWSNGCVIETNSNINGGIYDVTVTDCNGCSVVNTYTVSESGPEITNINVIQSPNCNPVFVYDITVGNGTQPFTYAWMDDNGMVVSTEEDLTDADGEIPYTLEITDGNGCMITEVFPVIDVVIPPLALTYTSTPVSCNELGSIDLVVSSGTAPYQYLWTTPNGSTTNTEDLEDLVLPGSYSCIVTDSNGCSSELTLQLEGDEALTVSGGIESACPGEANGFVQVALVSGCGPVSYEWSTGATSNISTNLAAGTYEVTITDCNGCSIVESYTVGEHYDPQALLQADTICQGGSTDLFVTLMLQNPTEEPYEYSWSPDDGTLDCTDCGTPTASPETTTVYDLVLTDTLYGCSFNYSVTVDVIEGCVWPGDTDTTNIVNHFDLLPIGLSYGETGPNRPNAGLGWFGQEAPNWLLNTPGTTVNLKHVDTNGDGTVNDSDTLAVIQNWGSVHALTSEDGDTRSFENAIVSEAPFYIEPDTVNPGESLILPVILGDNDNPAEDVYGIGFSIEYDSVIVDASTARLEFMDSWLGANEDLLHIQRDFYSPGRVDIAVTRIDGQPMTGQGMFAEFFITIEDDIFLLIGDSRSLFDDQLPLVLNITNVYTVNHEGTPILIEGESSTGLILDNSTNTSDLDLDEKVSVFPNPVNEMLQVYAPNLVMENIKVYSIFGQLILEKEVSQADEFSINMKKYPAGVYLISLETAEGKVVKRVEKL